MFPRVTIESAQSVLQAAIKAQTRVCFIGSPGIGKTAIVEGLSSTLKVGDLDPDHARAADPVKVHTLIGSTLDPTDIGGWPIVDGGTFRRIPMKLLRECVDTPAVLFLDELSTCPKAVEAALLRLVHGGWAGDVRLHPATAIVAAQNPTDEAPGATELSAAMAARWAIYHLIPSLSEVETWFRDVLGGDAGEVGHWARDWAAIVGSVPDILELSPSQGSIDTGESWGSPRDWERGLRHLAALGRGADRDLQWVALAGSVGEGPAQKYLAIRDLRAHLPTVAEVAKDPKKALIPDDRGHQIGALALVAEVAQTAPDSAWLYSSRLDRELQAVVVRILGKHGPRTPAGRQAQISVVGTLGRAAGAALVGR